MFISLSAMHHPTYVMCAIGHPRAKRQRGGWYASGQLWHWAVSCTTELWWIQANHSFLVLLFSLNWCKISMTLKIKSSFTLFINKNTQEVKIWTLFIWAKQCTFSSFVFVFSLLTKQHSQENDEHLWTYLNITCALLYKLLFLSLMFCTSYYLYLLGEIRVEKASSFKF